MWAFLGSDCMFFGTLISTHLIYRKISATVGGNFLDIRDVFDIELTSFSTFILLASSLFMALAVSAIHKGNLNSTRWMLFGTIILVQFSLLVRSMNLLTSFTLRVTNSLYLSYRGATPCIWFHFLCLNRYPWHSCRNWSILASRLACLFLYWKNEYC